MELNSFLTFVTFLGTSFLFWNHSCQAAHLLRVGVLPQQNSSKLIVIGIEARNKIHSSNLDFQAIGFQGKGMEHLDPKFLLEIDERGIHKVYSFEGDEIPSDNSSTQGSDSVVKTLPPLLLDIDNSRTNQLKHLLGNFSAATGKSLGFPIATGTVLGRVPSKYLENLKTLQAHYLLELVNKTLPPFNLFPELRTALSTDLERADQFLRHLGQALIIRYNPKSNWSGLQIPNNKNGNFYERWRQVQIGKRMKNQGYLVRLANESELKIVQIGNEFAFVFIAQDTPTESLIPSSLISFIHPEGPLELINFDNPGNVGKRSRILAKNLLLRELGGSIIPFSNWVIHKLNKSIESFSVKPKNTDHFSKIESYGALLALTESHVYQFPKLEPIQYEIFTEALHSLDSIHPIANAGELGNDPQGLNDIAFILGHHEEVQSRLLSKFSHFSSKEMKSIYWNRLKLLSASTHPNPSPSLSDQRSQSSSSSAILNPSPSLISLSSMQANMQSKEPKRVTGERKPVILFLIDGLRPDRFLQAAHEGLLPRLKSLFVDRGTEIESYTTRSLTLPSWTTLFTGFENDMNGIRSNRPTSRLSPNQLTNFLDPIDDLKNRKTRKKNRAFRLLEESNLSIRQKVWIADYFENDQSFYNYLPIVQGPHFPIRKIISYFMSHLSEYANNTLNYALGLDITSAQQTAQAIRGDKNGRLRLVMNWYSSVDSAGHHNNYYLPTIYKALDQAIGEILDAAQLHPSLKNATVFLISDHGHSGGFGPFDTQSTVHVTQEPYSTTSGPFLTETAFNVTKFLSGGFKSWQNYWFNVGTPHPAKTETIPASLHEFILQSVHFPDSKSGSERSAIVDFAGDNLVQIYLSNHGDWKQRRTYYDLTHLRSSEGEKELNLIDDLIHLKMKNLNIQDRDLAEKILFLTQASPVELFAMSLQGEQAKTFSNQLGKSDRTAQSTREPVLVISKNPGSPHLRTALILTRSDTRGNDLFRYIVIKNFNQTSSTCFEGEVSLNPNDDPLEYLATIPEASHFDQWRTDREWLKLAQAHKKPTVLFSLPRILTLAPRFTQSEIHEVSHSVQLLRQSEIPDFILTSNPGYSFHDGMPMESNHGGMMREEVRNSFFITSLNQKKFMSHQVLRTPILNRDIFSTVLHYAGVGESPSDPLPQTQGESFLQLIEDSQPADESRFLPSDGL